MRVINAYPLLALILLTACAGQIHRVQPTSSCRITEADAETILSRAVAKTFPAVETSRVPMSGGVIRYQAKMRVLLDEHVISATAIPQADKANSFEFTVSDFGSLLARGPVAAEELSEVLRKETTAHCGG